MFMLKVVGSWLNVSGWSCDDFGQCDNRRTRIQSFERCTHITGRWSHQVTAAALYILLQKSYAEYELHTPDDEQMTYMRNGQSILRQRILSLITAQSFGFGASLPPVLIIITLAGLQFMSTTPYLLGKQQSFNTCRISHREICDTEN